MNEYEAKQQERRERMLDRADAKEQEAQRRSDFVWDTVRQLNGQPVLVGHHSEKGHRRLLDRVHNNLGKSVALNKEAAELRRRAAAKGGISSDDPDAVGKLQAKLARLESEQEVMRAVNKAWRRAGRPAPGDDAGWQTIAGTVTLTAEQLHNVRAAMARDPLNRGPFPDYALSNNSANMKRIAQRIASLQARADQETVEQDGDGYRIIENVEANRLQIVFDAKPDADVRSRLKAHGFRWSPSEGAWQRHLNNGARMAADWALNRV